MKDTKRNRYLKIKPIFIDVTSGLLTKRTPSTKEKLYSLEGDKASLFYLHKKQTMISINLWQHFSVTESESFGGIVSGHRERALFVEGAK